MLSGGANTCISAYVYTTCHSYVEVKGVVRPYTAIRSAATIGTRSVVCGVVIETCLVSKGHAYLRHSVELYILVSRGWVAILLIRT